MSALKTVEVIQKKYLVEVYPPDSPARQIEVNAAQQVSIMLIGTQGPPGPAGASALAASVVGETPIGAVNGVNASFQTAFDFIPESVAVVVNGLQLKKVDEFNTSGTRNISLSVSPNAGEIILVNYLRI
jgi:hypothetical protein